AVFLTIQGLPGFSATKADINGAGQSGAANFVAYAWPLVFGTLLAAVIALLIATPLSIGVALMVSHYAPRRLSAGIGYLIDLLAAVPSVVYGLWGILYLAPRLVPIYAWLTDHVSWFPLFAGPAAADGRTIMTASIVLAIMVLPIITAISREIFSQTPTLNQEAALALGATRWEMLRLAVFPYSRSGVISAVMLGLGRAMGETMAVAMVLSASGIVTFNMVSDRNPSTIAANIALNFPESSGKLTNVLILSGLVLFVITFVVNFAARWIVARTENR
ncbi:MAG: phosphate ABC transporter permease subunit PstC, partial [Marmoricola sp.]